MGSIGHKFYDVGYTCSNGKKRLHRKRRQAQGVQKAKELGKYKGRPDNIELQNSLKENIKKIAMPFADEQIANEVLKLIKN